jgi:hypothetical protein
VRPLVRSSWEAPYGPWLVDLVAIMQYYDRGFGCGRVDWNETGGGSTVTANGSQVELISTHQHHPHGNHSPMQSRHRLRSQRPTDGQDQRRVSCGSQGQRRSFVIQHVTRRCDSGSAPACFRLACRIRTWAIVLNAVAILLASDRHDCVSWGCLPDRHWTN